MKKDNDIAALVLRFLRTVLFADLILAAITAVACYLLDIRSLEAYGTVLVWVGFGMMIVAGITGVGGFASRAGDAAAYSLSGAGNSVDNLQRITDARSSNLGCFVHMVIAAIVLIFLGYIIQFIPGLF